MWRLRTFYGAELFEIDEITEGIFDKYKYALNYIGVDFSREDVQEAIVGCSFGMEDAFQATISYWGWKEENEDPFDYPSAFLIRALRGKWKPYHWNDNYLDNPKFQNPCQRWWNEAAENWGDDYRNTMIADVRETPGGDEEIVLMSGRTITLDIAKVWGWDRLKEYIDRLHEERMRYQDAARMIYRRQSA